MKDLVGKRTRRAFADYLTGVSVLRQISAYFEDAEIELGEMPNNESSQRRSLVQGYFSSIDWTSEKDVAKVINAFEVILADTNDAGNEYSINEREKLINLLAADGYELKIGKLVAQSSISRSNVEVLLGAEVLDKSQLTQAFKRIESSVTDDPDNAIGNAKELIETVCKHILDELNISYKKGADVPTLVKATCKELNLLPASIPTSTKGAETIKRLLSNLGTVAQGIAELRNLYGTGHGKPKGYKGLSKRHARLAVNSALALTVFLVETYEEREASKP